MTSSTYAQWEGLRELVRARVGDTLRRQVPELRLTPIDLAALNAAKPWRAAQAVGWEWPAVIKRRRANRFDLAIWHGEILCGLAYGPADAAWVAIGFLQSNPDPAHPLRGRVIPIALAVLEAQMQAANAAEARLLSPFPELVPRYEARGYQRVADRPDLDYLRKQRTAP